MDDPAATWLWRALREAEAAGFDGPGALRRAMASGSLEDAESVAKVADWRIRQQIAGMPAVAARPWLEQVPVTGDEDMGRYARELAEAMDERQYRLGEHAAEHQLEWALALGPVPDHPLDRAGWEQRAGPVAAYREMWGWTHPREPIGARPGQHSPEARASWQAAAEALGYQPGSLREHSDGKLWVWRSAFAREMAWAPPYKGDDLALVRVEIRRTQIEADRARRHAEAAGSQEARQWKSELEARQREAVRHEPMPRVPHAEAIAAEAARIPRTRTSRLTRGGGADHGRRPRHASSNRDPAAAAHRGGNDPVPRERTRQPDGGCGAMGSHRTRTSTCQQDTWYRQPAHGSRNYRRGSARGGLVAT